MNKQNWDYNVTEVDRNFDYENLKMPPEEKFIKTEAMPTIVIFGWAGATDKQLNFYSKIYEDRGLNTVRYTVPPKILFFNASEMLKIGEEMARVFSRQKFKDSPIIFHMLSNGGLYEYQVFMRGLHKISSKCQVKGAIFDSCPVNSRPLGLYKAIGANVHSKHFKAPITLYLTVYCMLKRSLETYFFQLFNKEYILMTPYKNLINEKNRFPQHFIYSTADKIVPREHVESFANRRKTLGVDVSMKCYQNAPHVQNYAKNKSSYIRSVVKFVNKCLKK